MRTWAPRGSKGVDGGRGAAHSRGVSAPGPPAMEGEAGFSWRGAGAKLRRMELEVHVHAEPEALERAELDGALCVVIDVLRATTTALRALEAGALGVWPCASLAEARERRAELGSEHCLLGGEREGVAPAGFDLGNSPNEYTRERVRGRAVVLTTTNGTRALAAARRAAQVWIGCFANRTAVAREVVRAARDRPLHLACAGRHGRPGPDDELCAGAIVAALAREGSALHAGDGAARARDAWDESLARGDALERALSATEAGSWLVGLGFAADVRAAAACDTSARVPRLSLEATAAGTRRPVLR